VLDIGGVYEICVVREGPRRFQKRV
jgi:hypothetical protein